MLDLEKGDVVQFEDKDYGYLGYDQLNEKHVVEDDDGNQFFAEIDPEQELNEEGTAAAASIQGKPTPASSKSMMMAQLNSQLAAMDETEATQFFDQMMGQIGNEAPSISPSQAAQNKSSIDAKKAAMKEDLENLFGSEQLSEEFRIKTSTLFESAVNARVEELVQVHTEELNEEYEQELASLQEGLMDSIDSYLTEAVNEWMEENEVAIEKSLSADLNEDFMVGLKELFEKHYIEIPEDRVDVVEQLAEELDEVTEIANEAINENIQLTEILSEVNRRSIVEELTDGLPVSEAEKLKELAETIDFNGDEDEYTEKVKTLVEHHSQAKSSKSTNTPMNLFEEVNVDNEDEKPVNNDPRMRSYIDAISRSI